MFSAQYLVVVVARAWVLVLVIMRWTAGVTGEFD